MNDDFCQSRLCHKALVEAFVPNEGQIAWARQLVSAIRDGGLWRVPATGQVYRLDKQAKTLTLVSGDQDDELGWHQNNIVLFGKIGYAVLDTDEQPEQIAFAEAMCLVDALLNESPELKTLKAARRSLNPEEKADAGGAPVWKATVNGKTYYVVNTHRAYQAKSTVKGAAHAWYHGVEQSG